MKAIEIEHGDELQPRQASATRVKSEVVLEFGPAEPLLPNVQTQGVPSGVMTQSGHTRAIGKTTMVSPADAVIATGSQSMMRPAALNIATVEGSDDMT